MPPCPTGRGGIRRSPAARGLARSGAWTPSGAELSRSYFEQRRAPRSSSARWPRLPYAAARLGSGSDVLGLDDAMSRDHDWGLRLNLLVPADARRRRRRRTSPSSCPTRSRATRPGSRRRGTRSCATGCRSRRPATSPCRGSASTPRPTSPSDDWLSLTGQAVLEVTAGEVFADDAGELDGIRRRLEWYPDDVWRHVVATDWARARPGAAVRRPDGGARRRPRLAGRRGAAGRGRDAPRPPARAALAALRQVARHELRRDCRGQARRLGAAAGAPWRPTDWREREAGLVEALRVLSRVQARRRAPDRRRSGRAVLGPALPRRARRRRRRGSRQRSPTRPCGRCRGRRLGRAVERQRRRARRTPVAASHHEIEWQMVLRLVW